MNVVFKPDETFRDDFTFRNSTAAIRRFPLPFPEDRYMYSVNIEEHQPGPPGSVIEFPIDIDEHYVAECRERALVLAEEPQRFQALPHMMSSQWDCLELIMESLKTFGEKVFRNPHVYKRDKGQPLVLDKPPARGPSELHIRRPCDTAPTTSRVHHTPGPGRLGCDGSTGGGLVV